MEIGNRAALDQPEPEGPSDKELLAEAAKALGYLSTPPWEFDLAPMSADDLLTVQRAAIAADRAKQQQIQVPVLVNEMPWQQKDWCHPQERWAWFYSRRVGWRDAIPPESLEPPTLFPYTHSLPFNVLPLP